MLLGDSDHRPQNKVIEQVWMSLGPGFRFIHISTVTLTTPNLPTSLSSDTTQKASVRVPCVASRSRLPFLTVLCLWPWFWNHSHCLYVWTLHFGISLAFAVHQQGCRNQSPFLHTYRWELALSACLTRLWYWEETQPSKYRDSHLLWKRVWGLFSTLTVLGSLPFLKKNWVCWFWVLQ